MSSDQVERNTTQRSCCQAYQSDANRFNVLMFLFRADERGFSGALVDLMCTYTLGDLLPGSFCLAAIKQQTGSKRTVF